MSLSLKPDSLQTHDFFPDIQLLSDTSSPTNDTEVRNTSKFHKVPVIEDQKVKYLLALMDFMF